MKPHLMRLLFPTRKPVLRGSDGTVARFEFDLARRLYFANGVYYNTPSAMLASAGGLKSLDAYTFGPYLDPLATNLLTNGDFTTNTTGWGAFAGGSIASVGGELELTAGGNLSCASQGVTAAFRAFRFRATGRRGTTTNNLVQGVSLVNSALGSAITGTFWSTTSPVTQDLYFGVAAGTAYVGVRNTSAAGTGTALFDDLSVVEAWPFAGYPNQATGYTIVVEGVTGATPASTQVIWQADDNSERERIRIAYGTDRHVHYIVTVANGPAVDLDLGEVAANTAFKLAFAVKRNDFAASLDGSVIAADNAGDHIGVSHMRVGRSFTGEAFAGTITRVAVTGARENNDWLQYVAGPANTLHITGDSYASGANGVSLQDSLRTATSRATANTGAGGLTLTQILAVCVARPYLRDRVLVIWDGSANGYGTVAAYLAVLAEIVAWKGDGRFLFVPPLALPPTTAGAAYTLDMQAIRDGAIAAYGASRVYDPVPAIQALSTGDANDLFDLSCDVIPRSTLQDGVHLTQPAMTAAATGAAVKALLL